MPEILQKTKQAIHLENIWTDQAWDSYLKADVAYVRERRYHHYYNEIPYTKWPFYICVTLFFFIFFGILSLNKYTSTGYLTVNALILMLYYIYLWFNDLLTESVVFGKYNRKLRAVIVAGFILFLGSEVMLFGGFFWVFLDRLFHSPIITSGNSVPVGIESLIWYKKPLYATLILMFSTIAFNGASYSMKWGSWTYALAYSTFGLFLGYLFLLIQLSEYKHLSFSINDSVNGACFYSLTGFHGFHVVVGMIFLSIQHERLLRLEFSRERHLGYSLAMIYWHFVDIVRIFLFLLVYGYVGLLGTVTTPSAYIITACS